MKLGGALFLAYLLIFALCFSYPAVRFAKSLRTHYLESVEAVSYTHLTLPTNREV